MINNLALSIEEIPIEPMRCLTVDAEDELY